MSDIRIFSYLPNPRLYKTTIAARISGATVEIVGAPPKELANWLWDYEARELTTADRSESSPFARQAKTGFSGTLYKTDAFLKANPYGDVPAAFGAEGDVGLFESNSIMRAAARLGSQNTSLYGDGPLQASRIDGFLDRALVFARDMQRYLLAGRSGFSKRLYEEMDGALNSYLGGAEQALQNTSFLASEALTLADIAFACEVCLFSNEVHMKKVLEEAQLTSLLPKLFDYPRTAAHLERLAADPNFSADLAPYFEKIMGAKKVAS